MYKAKQHKVLIPVFKWLTRFLIQRNFNSVNIYGEFADNGKPVLVIANHISWWDGFWIEYLNLKKIHRKFHFMMLEEQLKKHWYFQYIGGYSIKKKSRNIIESLNYSIELLQQPENVVLMFPQGQIHSLYNDNVHFESGIERIIHKVSPDTQILFTANLVDYLSDSKPNLFIYIKTFTAKNLSKVDIAEEYENFYHQVINTQKVKTS